MASFLALPSAALAQPLNVVVNPLAAAVRAPFAIIAAPFGGLDSRAPVTNEAAARAAAVSVTPDGFAVVPTPALRQVGPTYRNPPNADFRRPVVIRQGSTVPGFIDTAPARNISVAGLAPNARYEYFVAPDQNIVFVEPGSRRVARILR